MNFTNTFKKYPILGKALNYIITNSESIFKPYHNLNHNITVTVFSEYIGKNEGLSTTQMNELLLAAIFHDFNHSGGAKKDNENIEAAKEGIKKFIQDNNIKNVNIDNINSIIDATEYPYIIPADKLNKQQKIIRDADLCQLFEPHRLQSNYLGLAEESKIDITNQIKNQDKFLSSISFNTKTANGLFDKHRKSIEDEVNYLSTLM